MKVDDAIVVFSRDHKLTNKAFNALFFSLPETEEWPMGLAGVKNEGLPFAVRDTDGDRWDTLVIDGIVHRQRMPWG